MPHVTLAQELSPPEGIEATSAAAGRLVRIRHPQPRPTCCASEPDRVWVPLADAGLGTAAVIGRGGIEIELTVTARPDPEAAALLDIESTADGRPWAVTARIGSRVVGTAWGWSSGSVAIVADLAVASAHRGQGVGRKLLAAVESDAVIRRCDVGLIAAPG